MTKSDQLIDVSFFLIYDLGPQNEFHEVSSEGKYNKKNVSLFSVE